MRARTVTAVLTLSVLTAAVFTGSAWLLWFSSSQLAFADSDQSALGDKPARGEQNTLAKKPRVYICPMHPQVRQSSAGDCPICGMHLVPAEQSSLASAPMPAHHHAALAADHDMQPSMAAKDAASATSSILGLRTDKAAIRTLAPRINTWARVVADGANEAIVTAPADGWIKHVYVPTAGLRVTVGTPLFELYSPELDQRQRDYIDTLNRREQLLRSITDMSGQNGEMLGSLARERKRQRDIFLRIGVAESALDTIEKFRRPLDTLTIAAAQSGLVTAVNAREGASAGPSTSLFTMVNDNVLQLDVVLTPSQFKTLGTHALVALDRDAEAMRAPLPLRRALFRTDLQSYVVRTPWQKNTALQPGAVIDVAVTSEPLQVLAVPKRAILAGPSGSSVVLAKNDGEFISRPVITGVTDSMWIEIKHGIKTDDVIVTDGQFLLDAAATLQSTLSSAAAF